jgi:hypothetical protein
VARVYYIKGAVTMKLSSQQKESISTKLSNYGFYEFQIPALLQGKKILTSWGHAKIKKADELHVYKQYNDTNTIIKL